MRTAAEPVEDPRVAAARALDEAGWRSPGIEEEVRALAEARHRPGQAPLPFAD